MIPSTTACLSSAPVTLLSPVRVDQGLCLLRLRLRAVTRVFKVEQLDCMTCDRKVRVRVPVADTSAQHCPDCGTTLLAIGRLELRTDVDEGWRELMHDGGWVELSDGSKWVIEAGVIRIRPPRGNEEPPY